MRYWVYINDKVDGPFEKDSLTGLPGFTMDTLICAESTGEGANQEWVKASTVIDSSTSTQENSTANAAVGNAGTSAQESSLKQNISGSGSNGDLVALLLSKLDSITSQMTNLQSKLDGVENKFDASMENVQKTLEKQQQAFVAATQNRPVVQEEQSEIPANTTDLDTTNNKEPVAESAISPDGQASIQNDQTNEIDMLPSLEEIATPEALSNTQENKGPEVSAEEENKDSVLSISADNNIASIDSLQSYTVEDSLNEEGKVEEEAIVTSALDSLYNAKLQPQDNESTFQDLLSPKEAQKLSTQLDAVNEKKSLDQVLQETSDQAPLEGEARENLINQITATPAEEESALDKLLNEQATSDASQVSLASIPEDKTEEKSSLKDAIIPTVAAGAAAVAAMAAINKTEENKPTETETKEEPAYTVPSLDSESAPIATNEQEEESKDEIKELVANSTVEQKDDDFLSKEDLANAFSKRETSLSDEVSSLEGSANSQQVEPVQTTENGPQGIPSIEEVENKDVPTQVAPTNASDVTEIEIKEGGTFVISDFVPMEDTNAPKTVVPATQDAKENTVEIQDLVSSLKQEASEQDVPEDAPEKTSISQVILENTIRAKKGASLDIKTVPMVAEPANTERLHIEGFDDSINAQHDVKMSDDVASNKNTTKMVLLGLGGFLGICILYVVLAFTHLLPDSINFLAGKKAQQDNTVVEEMIPSDQSSTTAAPAVNDATNAQETTEQTASVDPKDIVLEDVQNYPLANGYTLKEFIEQKHPVAEGLITWNITPAVEPDNYSILVKVPPENPQSFKIAYRFNYNTVTRDLQPTISDAKNLLDSVNQ